MSSPNSIYKIVAYLPPELLPDSLYLVRTGVGFDLYATDSYGGVALKINGIDNKFFELLAPALFAQPKALSLMVPYLFNTRANSTTWNTGFARILDNVSKYKLLKFYVVLDLYSLNALTLERALEGIAVLRGCGAVPLAYVSIASDTTTTQLRDTVTLLNTRYGGNLGIYLHANYAIDGYSLEVLSTEMSKYAIYPLVVYTENTLTLTPELFDNNHGDIFLSHFNANGNDDTLYNTLATLPYHHKGALIHSNSSESAIATLLAKYTNTATLLITSVTNPSAITTSTLPSYFDNYVAECNKYLTKLSSQFNEANLIGSVSYFATATIPPGWLICNGASVSRTTYANLFAAIGTTYGSASSSTFNLPDLRGIFLRGLDLGRGYDTDRTLGTLQSDGVAKHSHLGGTMVRDNGISSYGSNEVVYTGSGYRYVSTTVYTGYRQLHYTVDNMDNAPIPLVGNTRPINLAMYPCIKY